jgi:outer membrane immunogenic protein
MKRTILCELAVSALLIGVPFSAALAADMPLKAPPPPPVAACTWCGWYVGGNVGAAINDSRDTVEPTGLFLTPPFIPTNPLRTDSANLNKAAFTGGGQLGFNWQTGQVVWGLETDINYNGVNQTDTVSRALAAPLLGMFNHSVNERFDWFGTFRGRLGWTPAPTWLIYGTGGLAYGHISSSSNVMFTFGGDTYTGSTSTTRAGWAAGAGTEWMFAPRWSAKVEFLYVDLGKFSYADGCVVTTVCFVPGIPNATYQTDLRIREGVVRVGANYHF